MIDEKRLRVDTEVPVQSPASEIEKIAESQKEKPVVVIAEKPTVEKDLPLQSAPTSGTMPVAPTPVQIDPITKEIEEILEEDLAKVYANLPDDLKPQFKAQGEFVARSIREMVARAKVKTRKVLKLIIGWLKMIPGVNKFFLEQEAAIKTQKIIILAEEEEEKK
ncbi:MAG: hypothetical protein Q7S48_04055 [bacterium]|nr:hypothetical protein [bacterium]